MAIGAMLAGAAVNWIGNKLTGESNAETESNQAYRNRAWELEDQARQESLMREAWARDDSKTQRFTEDLKKSGINPMLAAGNSTASQSSAQGATPVSGKGGSMGNRQATPINPLLSSQLEINRSQADLLRAQADSVRWNTGTEGNRGDTELAEAAARINRMEVQNSTDSQNAATNARNASTNARNASTNRFNAQTQRRDLTRRIAVDAANALQRIYENSQNRVMNDSKRELMAAQLDRLAQQNERDGTYVSEFLRAVQYAKEKGDLFAVPLYNSTKQAAADKVNKGETKSDIIEALKRSNDYMPNGVEDTIDDILDILF